jgi:uncharacterized protein with NRDE domain
MKKGLGAGATEPYLYRESSMCTLVLAWRVFPDLPVLAFANRDERLDRASEGPSAWGAPRAYAPRDLVAGGTWLGVTPSGLFVAITNRAGALPDPAKRSRGALVVDALSQPSARACREALRSLDAGAHNPFHLLYADADAAFLTWDDGARLQHRVLDPGLWLVTERGHDGEGVAAPTRVRLIREAWARIAKGGPPDDEALRAILATHDAASPFDGVCVHLDVFPYGTRSAAIVRVPDRVQNARFTWFAGRPCAARGEDRSAELRVIMGAP